MQIVEHFAVGGLPQHVTPSWDLKTLYVDNDHGNSLTPIDPNTGQTGHAHSRDRSVQPVLHTRRPATRSSSRRRRAGSTSATRIRCSSSTRCRSRATASTTWTSPRTASFALASCEFSGDLLVVDMQHQTVVQTVTLPRAARTSPQDVKLSPDGSLFYVADMTNGGCGRSTRRPSRSSASCRPGAARTVCIRVATPSTSMSATGTRERSASSTSRRGRSSHTWVIPGGSPDMGGVSVDGRVLWLSGRYNAEVYAISTTDGHLLARIPVGAGRTGSASGRSRAATRSDTPASCAERGRDRRRTALRRADPQLRGLARRHDGLGRRDRAARVPLGAVVGRGRRRRRSRPTREAPGAGSVGGSRNAGFDVKSSESSRLSAFASR